jgi:hypothetical protein
MVIGHGTYPNELWKHHTSITRDATVVRGVNLHQMITILSKSNHVRLLARLIFLDCHELVNVILPMLG